MMTIYLNAFGFQQLHKLMLHDSSQSYICLTSKGAARITAMKIPNITKFDITPSLVLFRSSSESFAPKGPCILRIFYFLYVL